MATRILSASIFSTQKCISSLFFRSYSSLSIKSPSSLLSLSSRFRCIAALPLNFNRISPAASSIRCFSTRQTTTSLNDSNPNWSNRPPKETILLDGCDFEHWLIVMEKPEGEPTRDEIIDSYIKTLATIVGSEEEARMKIYSVSTRHYYAFGALISEELSYKMKELEKVRWVLPDSYLDVKNKDYGGEPFINGQAVPYDPKYHEEWVRNNARANERNRRNDRPRNFDRSRNFERRRENTQNNMGGGQPGMGGPQNMGGPPAPGAPPNMGGGQPAGMGGGPGARPIMGGGQQAGMGGGPGSPPNMGGGQAGMGGPQQYMGGSSPNIGGGQAGMGGPQQYMGGAPPNMGQMPQNNMGGGQPGMGGPQNMGRMPQNINMGGMPQNNNMGGMPQNSNLGGMPQNSNLGGMPHNNNMGGMPHNNNMGGMPQNNRGSAPNMGGVPPNMGGVPPNMGAGNFQPRNVPNNEGFPLQSGPGPNSQYQNYPPNMPAGGNPHQTQDMPGRDMPPPNYHQ